MLKVDSGDSGTPHVDVEHIFTQYISFSSVLEVIIITARWRDFTSLICNFTSFR